MKVRPPTPGMSKQASAREPGTDTPSTVQGHMEEGTSVEPNESSPLRNTYDTSSPEKVRGGNARKSFPKTAQESRRSHSSSPSASAKADKQYVEAKAKEVLQPDQFEVGVKSAEALFSGKGDTEIPVNPISSINQPTHVSDEVNECSGTLILDSGEEVIPLLTRVTLEVSSVVSGSAEELLCSSTITELPTSEEVILGDDVSEDSSLHREFKSAVFFSPGKDTEARLARRSRRKAFPASPSSSSLITIIPSTDEAPETDTNATGVGDQSIESSENQDGKPLDRISESSDRHQSTDSQNFESTSQTVTLLPPASSSERHSSPSAKCDHSDIWMKGLMISSLGIKSNHHDPESSVTHEDKSGTPNSFSCQDDQVVAKIFTRSGNGFPEACEASVKDNNNQGNNDIELLTDDSSSEDEISASKEHASRMPSEDTENDDDTPNTPKKIVETARTTRSGTRFSDETNMLRDFLSRAQARKAAKDVSGSTEAPGLTTSCRRSPRKSLAEIDNNSPSSEKPRNARKRRGTPPGKPKPEIGDLDDLDEVAFETSSHRRSTRTRLFTPARPAPEAPSLIPVRRADGGDNIKLRRSSAQELATVTRANTRRNRGQSKPPKLVLRNLSIASLPTEVLSQRGDGCGKSVGWDETLVYYQATSSIAPAKEVKRTRSRKVGALGSGDAALAPTKETTEALSSNGTMLGPKHRGRSKQ